VLGVVLLGISGTLILLTIAALYSAETSNLRLQLLSYKDGSVSMGADRRG
jgi:hypothetical protein